MERDEYDLLDRLETGMWWYRGLHRQIGLALKRAGVGSSAGLVLDAGCGTGGTLAHLGATAKGIGRIGLEVHPPAAARAAAKAGCPVVAGSVLAIPLADGCCAAVLSADVLGHARVDPEPALREMARVLEPGGWLILNLPAYGWLLSEHDRRVHNVRRFTAGVARRSVEAAGLRVVRITYWNSFLLPLMILRRVFGGRDGGKSDVMEYPRLVDALFGAILWLERAIIATGLRLPAGGSVLVVARKDV